MRTRPVPLVALVAALSLAGAMAAEPAAPAAKQRQICRTPEKQIGSRIRAGRRCRTEAQWQDEDDAKARLPVSMQVTAGQNDGQTKAQPR